MHMGDSKIRRPLRRVGAFRPVLLAFLLLVIFSGKAFAEMRLYHLRVTLRSGIRYETISSYDPINYCHMNGGSVMYSRDGSLIYSPQMKVRVIRSWIEREADLSGRWRDILRANNMLASNNHRLLARTRPLTFEDLMTPE